MKFMALIMLSDFIHILNSIRKHPAKNEYFPMHILFSTIYLLQGQNLNNRNYSMQKINMGNFEDFTFLCIFVTKYSMIWFIGIFLEAITYKMQFDQTYCKYILTSILRKFISYLSKFYFIFYEFWNLERISGNSKWKKLEKEKRCTVLGSYSAHGFAPLAQPRGENGQPAHATGAVWRDLARSPRASTAWWRGRRWCFGGRNRVRSSPKGRGWGGGIGHGQDGGSSPEEGVHGGAAMAALVAMFPVALMSSSGRRWWLLAPTTSRSW
jgi:hypothetical protein